MILLDTNIISELMRSAPEPRVVSWLDAYDELDVWVSSITVAEIFLGIALLPAGKRRSSLVEVSDQMFLRDFHDRCLPFDQSAAMKYAAIVAERKRKGRPISVEDAQIAAIAIVGGLTLATRNTKDFADIEGLQTMNPWAER
ncbi:MAG: type II toxin-antitoxin system VapC family toxin [Candidatus Riflebacteria bacterium]|nr:type II toxin-antitoxin system VapC family toxin [Candidatus Riflebacteria bacterium]